jgi:polysaccharide lyase-like protein
MRFIMSPRVPSASASIVVSMVTAVVACSSGGGSNVIVMPGATNTATSAGTSESGTPTSVVSGTGTSSSSSISGAPSSVAPSSGGSSSNATLASGSSASSSLGGGGDDGGIGGGTGAGTDAGTGTASAGDAGQGGPSLCATAVLPPPQGQGATLCEGFETAPYKFTSMPAGAMVADTTQFYRGKTSMYFALSSMAYLVESTTFTQGAAATKTANNNFWGRYFFLSNIATTALVPKSHAVFGTMMGTDTSSANADAFHFVGGSRGKLQTQIQFASDVFSDDEDNPAATDPNFPLMSDGWQCWEFQLTDDDSYTFYIAGVAVPEMTITAGKGANPGKNFSPLPTVTSLELGWQYFGTGMYSGWIDEIAVGPNRIPCGN